MSWQQNLITSPAEVMQILKQSRTIAVLGIKTQERAEAAAYYVPEYLQERGYTIIPVPVYHPEATQILGERVQRDLTAITTPVDVLDVFRRAEDIPAHLDAILTLKPRVVWFQLGIRNDEAAQTLAEAGIKVIQDRCMLADHRNMRVGQIG